MPVYNVHPTGNPHVSAPDLLEQHGLLLQAEVNIPQALADVLTAQGLQIPTGIGGSALIDTGASICCIEESVARQLGLLPIGQATICGVAGARVHNTYMARVSFPGTPVPELELQLTGVDLKEQDLVFIIGRDFLRHCVLIYNGLLGCYTISF